MKPILNRIVPQVCKLPDPYLLANGVEMNAIPLQTELVAISIMFGGGQWVQNKKLQADYAVNLINAGTENMSARMITQKLDYYGVRFTSGASLSFSYVSLTCLKRNLVYVLPILCDIINNPQYEQQQLDNAIEEGLVAWQMSNQKVAQVAKRNFYKCLLGEEHPGAQFPDENDYLSVTREDLLDYHSKYLNLSNAVLYVTGIVDDELNALLNSTVGAIKCDTPKMLVLPTEKIASFPNRRVDDELKVPSVQSGIRLGKVLPDCNHEDYPALLLTSVVLGGYFGSRLMSNIRERLGYTYGIGSTFYRIPNNNILIIATETADQYTESCIEEIKKEIEALRTNLVDEEELNKARNYMLGQFCRTTETSLSLSLLLMTLRTSGRSLNAFLDEQKKVLEVTPEDLQRVALKYLDVNSMTVSVVTGAKEGGA